jgi:hypothetical protein
MLVKAAAYAGAELEGTADGDGGGEEDHPQGPSLALVPGRLLVLDLGLRRLVVVLAAAPMMPKQRLRHLGRRRHPPPPLHSRHPPRPALSPWSRTHCITGGCTGSEEAAALAGLLTDDER